MTFPRLNRRRFLAAALTVSGTSLLPACVTAPDRDATRKSPPAPIPDLPLPRIEAGLVTGEVTGLRPFRPSGFRVEPERFDGKLILHHYGHGGCGVTLSWGTARLLLEQALAQPERRAAVIGCGAVGLATARTLQEQGFTVTLYARDLPLQTVSNVAGALWGPSFLLDPPFRTDEFGALLGPAMRTAHAHFESLDAGRYGVQRIPIYLLSARPVIPLSWEWGLCPELFPSTAHAPGQHPFGDRYAHEFRLLMIETPVYLPAVLEDFHRATGQLVQREFTSRSEILALGEPLIVNCTGLGARALFGDETLEPIKGQLTMLSPQPAINYGVIDGPASLYLLPRRDGLLLGGTHARGDWSMTPDPAAAARVMAGHQALFATGVSRATAPELPAG